MFGQFKEPGFNQALCGRVIAAAEASDAHLEFFDAAPPLGSG